MSKDLKELKKQREPCSTLRKSTGQINGKCQVLGQEVFEEHQGSDFD